MVVSFNLEAVTYPGVIEVGDEGRGSGTGFWHAHVGNFAILK
jgi:hypothetical protein